jgi:hypothetical protein
VAKDHLPWFPFYPKDWLSDGELRGCSPAARGLLMDLLCLMYGAEERGVLISNGEPWAAERVAASVTGFAADLLDVCLHELVAKGVLSRDGRGALCSRRMVREEDIRQKRAIAGRKGGLSKASKTLAKAKQTSGSGSISDSCNTKGGVGGKLTKAERDALWDTIVAIWFPSGVDPDQDAKRIGKLINRFGAKRNGKPDEIRRRHAVMVAAWGDLASGPESLAKWWDRFDGTAKPPAAPERPGRARAPAGKYAGR